MALREVLDQLNASGMHVFTTYDVAKMLGKSTAYASLLLSKSNKVSKIERGRYFLSGASAYEIASNIVFPSYVSLQAGLQFYSLIDQSVISYSVIAVKRHKPLDMGGISIKFIKTNKRILFGYLNKSGVYIASPEKLFIDCLYFGGVPFSLLEEALAVAKSEQIINPKTIERYALEAANNVLINKLGFLMDRAGINVDVLLRHRYVNYVHISNTGNEGINKKWGVKYDR